MHNPRCRLVLARIDETLRRLDRTITENSRTDLLLGLAELIMNDAPTLSAFMINDLLGEFLCECGEWDWQDINSLVPLAQLPAPRFLSLADIVSAGNVHRRVVARVWTITAVTRLCGRKVEEAIWTLRERPIFWRGGSQKILSNEDFRRDRRKVCKAFPSDHPQ